MYVVGDVEIHENLRRLIADTKIELKALEVKIKEKLRSKFVCFEKNLLFSFVHFTLNISIEPLFQ